MTATGGTPSRLGALVERNFRLVFTSTTVSALGDGVASIALVFAVLAVSHDSATAVGIVLACRQVAAAAIAVAAGVIADRLPRHTVLVCVALVQAVAQGVAGGLIVTGHATVLLLALLGVVYGLADGFVIPTAQGLIPAVVSAARLQQANALLGLSRSILGFAAPALGGILVTLGSPGSAILVDAASFVVAALLLLRVAVSPRDDAVVPEPFLRDLRSGWREFKRQTWIWTTSLFFALGNFAAASYSVLGPVASKQDLGGASAWAAVISASGVGAIVGGLVAMRVRVRRPLFVSCAAALPYGTQVLAFGLRAPLAVLIAVSVVAGASLAVHLALWFTVFQQRVPEEARSRVSAYDALGSFVLIPLGAAVAGPVAAVAGLHATMIGAGVVTVLCNTVILFVPGIWSIRDAELEPAPA